MIVSYPLAMTGRSFSLGKYSEQGEGRSQKLSNPPVVQGTSCAPLTLLLSTEDCHSAWQEGTGEAGGANSHKSLRTAPQLTALSVQEHSHQEVRGTCSRLLPHFILHHGLFAKWILCLWMKFQPRNKHCKSESFEMDRTFQSCLFCIQFLFDSRREDDN